MNDRLPPAPTCPTCERALPERDCAGAEWWCRRCDTQHLTAAVVAFSREQAGVSD